MSIWIYEGAGQGIVAYGSFSTMKHTIVTNDLQWMFPVGETIQSTDGQQCSVRVICCVSARQLIGRCLVT